MKDTGFALFRSLVDRGSWEADPKGKGFQKDWIFFKKGVLKGAVAGHPHVLGEEPGNTLPSS